MVFNFLISWGEIMYVNLKFLVVALLFVSMPCFAAKKKDYSSINEQDLSSLFLMRIKLSDEKTLNQRMIDYEFQEFNQLTKFSSTNASKEMPLITLVKTVDEVYKVLLENLQKSYPKHIAQMLYTTLLMRQETLYKNILLKDFPLAIDVVDKIAKA